MSQPRTGGCLCGTIRYAARVPSAGFRILQGMPRRYATVATRPDLVGLRVCTLDDPNWFRPKADIFMRSAQPWDHDETGVPKYDGYPPGRSYPIVTGP